MFIIFNELTFLKSLRQDGFSLIELLTVVSIIGVLSVVGIRYYQAQTNKARSAEAKHSLTFIFTAEQSFKDTWGTFHENLLVIGAIPFGYYDYDVGFNDTGLSKVDGNLKEYPDQGILVVKNCTSFSTMCSATTGTTACSGTSGTVTYNPTSCTVNPDAKNLTPTGTYTATEATFKAYAIGKLKSTDTWSVDQAQIITHVTDGTD